jgi:hypothetical protein
VRAVRRREQRFDVLFTYFYTYGACQKNGHGQGVYLLPYSHRANDANASQLVGLDVHVL